MNPKQNSRMLWIDNIRLLMIVLVVLVHANCTYSGFGSWYYRDSAGMGFVQSIIMGIFGSFTQAYFMGFLFFIAGFFVPETYDKKGFRPFMRDRVIRLGVPALLFMLLIHPFTSAFLLGNYYAIPLPMKWIGTYYLSGTFIGSTGPLWFAVALLVFTIMYAVLRRAGLVFRIALPSTLRHRHIIGFIVLVSAVSFLVRIVQPIGTSVLNMQLCYFTQYVVLFTLGIFARRAGWLESLDRRLAMRWLLSALVFGPIVWGCLMLFGGPADGALWVINGSGTWQSAVFAVWESFFCAGVCLGLTVLFRDGFDAQNRIVKLLSSNAFGVYVLHTPVLVAVSLYAAGLPSLPIVKAICVGAAAVGCSFAVAALVRMIPGIRRVL